MSWLSKWLHTGGKNEVLAQLAVALLDGKVTVQELRPIVAKVGLGVVDAGLPGQLQRVYDLTNPDSLRRLADKNVELALAEVAKVHSLLGSMLEGVK